VQSTLSGAPVFLNSGGGNDAVILGNAGSVQGINAAVNVANSGAFTSLTVDDSADTTSRTASISYSSITGLAPAAINYTQGNLGALTVDGGSGGNTFTEASTPANASLAVATTLNSGSGVDTVNVQAASGTDGATLQVNTQGGADTINVSSNAPIDSGNLSGLAGALTVDGGTGSNTLNVSESGISTADTVLLTSSQISSFVIPFSVNYSATGGSFGGGVYLTTGSGNDIINVQSTLSSATTTVNAGGGNDQINVLSTGASSTVNLFGDAGANTFDLGGPHAGSGILSAIQGTVAVATTSGGTSAVTLHDDQSTVASTYTITSSGVSVVRTGMTGSFTFTGGLASLTILAGTQADTINAISCSATLLTIQGNGGADVINIGDPNGGVAIFPNCTIAVVGDGSDQLNINDQSDDNAVG
jgi:hypothetical protein